jgi:phosphoribosyl 1,2-cyclic phosphodiesterase
VRLHLLGVRGSTPAPGAPFVRYGGHTSCIAIVPDGADAPVLVLDAGTGIRRLDGILGGEAFRGSLLLTHLHWDHVQGLPFCAAVDRPDARVRVLLPAAADGTDAADLLARGMSPPHFPIGPHELRGAWSFDGIEPGTRDLEGLSVTIAEVPHKGGRTFGYRVEDGRSSLAYVPDHGPSAPDCYEDGAADLARGVDILLHDAQHTAEEWPGRAQFGHASAEYAVELGVRCGVGRVVLFHHDPARTDDDQDRLVARFAGAAVPVTAAVEETVLTP